MRMLLPMLALAAAACTPADPGERAADQLEDAADARGKTIRAEAELRAGALDNQAEAIVGNVADAKSYDGRVAATRADALREEADLMRERAGAEAKATQSAAKAQADAIRAR